MTQNNREVRWVKLGEFISQIDMRNKNCALSEDSVRGISVDKVFTPTKANLEGVSLNSYKVVPVKGFAYVPDTSRRGDKIALAFNDSDNQFLISSIYTTFVISDSRFLPDYLYIWFSRNDFNRFARFHSWGSARETLPWSSFCDIKIPIPYKDGEVDVERQREVVEIWQGLRHLKEDNEALAAPLLELCQAKMEELKHTAPMTPLRDFIESCDERNSDLAVKLSQGISNMKYFQDPKQTAANSHNDKIVRTGQFAYNRATTRNGEKISIAYRDGADCTVSSAYQIFQLKDHKHFLPKFLMLWFMRPEFDRYARYMSKGSAHEFFEFEEMCRVQVPQPSIQVQQAIVDILACAEKAKAIADEANQQLKTICPALMQHIINS